ncbi:MAG: hypothetical protein A2161_21810 [Candidatus Schekmanbacteria bacterium RBG_13_48_7]|uniref:Dissimilatory sulphite reductase D domain-containing protein n=1 Tax=Candidatus Schekmanbacteria bacterium RBG_13_48_7 TaxID=1817878 RepID=A0A1F7RYN9_9BACT|nr:MAG: hypothetical protein A2161_21810 [Candidatus Schekmanbacteria bacterium RBG_13_48_7]
MSTVSVETIADAMYKMIAENAGKKKFKLTDLSKAMIAQFGETAVDKQTCKLAVRNLIESGRCVYTYFGGSFIEVPHHEGAAPPEQ